MIAIYRSLSDVPWTALFETVASVSNSDDKFSTEPGGAPCPKMILHGPAGNPPSHRNASDRPSPCQEPSAEPLAMAGNHLQYSSHERPIIQASWPQRVERRQPPRVEATFRGIGGAAASKMSPAGWRGQQATALTSHCEWRRYVLRGWRSPHLNSPKKK